MQKLYSKSLRRIFSKLGAEKVEAINIQQIKKLLQKKNVVLTDIDQTLFHKLPRQQLKNLFRNPCPISNAQQTNTQKVTIAKQIRATLNIVQKKVCFKCPFKSSCSHANKELQPNFATSRPLQNMLFTMNNMSILQQPQSELMVSRRSWFSGVRVNDSLNSVLDDLMNGGEDFKVFRNQRQAYIKENQQFIKNSLQAAQDLYGQNSQNTNTVQKPEKKKLKQNKQSKKQTQPKQQKNQNIFQKKKNDSFINIAKKYINQQDQPTSQKKSSRKQPRNVQKTEERKPSFQRKKYNDEQQQQNRPNKRNGSFQLNEYSRNRSNQGDRYKSRQQRSYSNNKSFREDRNSRGSYNRQNSSYGQNRNQASNYGQKKDYNNNKYDRYSNRDNNREGGKFQRKYDNDNKFTQRRPYDNQRKFNNRENSSFDKRSEEENPRIRKFSKQTKYEEQNQMGDRENRRDSNYQNKNNLNKFYSKIPETLSDKEQILSNVNKNDRYSRQNKSYQRGNQTFQNRGRPSNRDNSDGETNYENKRNTRQGNVDFDKQFQNLQKIPKILKTQYASQEEVRQIRKNAQNEQQVSERKGRRVRRG